jgi:hypothetical protein
VVGKCAKLSVVQTYSDFLLIFNLKARAWLYHALNDCLMESYLKCFSENRKTRTKSYLKSDGSFINDEQMLNLLQTLVCGLENVQFALFNVSQFKQARQ